MKNFTLRISFRIFLLFVSIFILALLFFQKEFPTLFFILLFTLYQIYLLIRFINSTNREITDFIRGINYSDFTQNVRFKKLGGTFAELADEMSKLINRIKETRFEKEENLRYLQTIVEHIGIGLLAFNSKGEVELINKGAKKLLNISHLKSIFSLEESFKGFGDFLFQIKAGNKSPYKISINGEVIQLMIHSAEFFMKQQNYKLIALYNIQTELDEKENEAWHKLIRVLTHEIMNSITPISSLATTVNDMIKNVPSQDKNRNDFIPDIEIALDTIKKRSEGLAGFVNKFRDISRVPKPNLQTIVITDLFYRIRLLVEPSITKNNIQLSINVHPENMQIVADPNLLEQVLINLVNNSIHALSNKSDGKIELTAEINEQGHALLKVSDNGQGIAEGVLEKVFIPFFTTKQEGSGIGLSISRSIIRAHGGTIWIHSVPDVETIFYIRL